MNDNKCRRETPRINSIHLSYATLGCGLLSIVTLLNGCGRTLETTASGDTTGGVSRAGMAQLQIIPTDPQLSLQGGDSVEMLTSDGTFSGRISSISPDQIVVRDPGGEERKFIVNDDTKYVLNGNEAVLVQLQEGYRVHVTALVHNLATFVDAHSAAK